MDRASRRFFVGQLRPPLVETVCTSRAEGNGARIKFGPSLSGGGIAPSWPALTGRLSHF